MSDVYSLVSIDSYCDTKQSNVGHALYNTVHHSTIACDMLWNNVQDAFETTQDHSTSLQMTAVSLDSSEKPGVSVADAVSSSSWFLSRTKSTQQAP